MSLAVLYACFVVLLYLAINPRQDFLYNKDWWAMACVCFCYVMASGQIWNNMRNPPVISLELFTRPDAQCVLESCIIAIIYIAIFQGIIKIIEAENEENVEIRDNNIITGIMLVFVLYGIIFIIFKKKTGDDLLDFLF